MTRNIVFNVLDIRRGTTVDGPGLRTSIYLAGCTHACPGCHNPDSWDFKGGVTMTLDEIMEVIDDEDFNVTLTGGDPLMHPHTLPALIHAIKERGKSVWLYTGYTIEQIEADPLLAEAPKLAVVLGTEGDGLKESTIAQCRHTVKIPMARGVDSLNVAAASAVAFWELRAR